MTDYALHKIISSDDVEYYMKTEVLKDGITVNLTDCQSSWSGKVSNSELKTTCSKIHMDYEDYLLQTKAALTGQTTKNMHFQYVVKQISSGIEVTWKKYVPGENVKFQLGIVKLSHDADPVQRICSLFQLSLRRTQELREGISDAVSKSDRLLAERDKALTLLKKSVEAKETLERDLYSKFQLVLNSKKQKLRQLKAAIEELSKSEPAIGLANHAPQPIDDESDSDDTAIDKSTTKHRISDDETTDEERQITLTKKSRLQRSSDFHATDSRSSPLLPGGDDEDDDDDVGTSVVVHRRRARNAPKNKTPAKAVLPKVSTSSAASLRKSTSNPRPSTSRSARKSRQETPKDSLDAEDLVNFM
ncbi:DNA repair protein XRCC4-like [Tubulanus polymorphus]|uniref:DNA repair protein XRCC4-like n=1 Tax=Tubulanus polymorphus TaxID=672921 RepID=UPI003DA44D3E